MTWRIEIERFPYTTPAGFDRDNNPVAPVVLNESETLILRNHTMYNVARNCRYRPCLFRKLRPVLMRRNL